MLVRGVFVLVVLIGGLVDRLQSNTAFEPASANAPLAAAAMGQVLPETPACQPAASPDRATPGDAGRRHVLSGSVRSSAGRTPIGGAKVEFWPAGRNAASDRVEHATLFADANGNYQLRCDRLAADGAYIYLRVSADGYVTLTTQYQARASQAEHEFDIVLQPRK